ncbi:putative Ankyrin [Bradyrhizobium sp. STM 3843]|uniref:ankyrin repeat domain-containing protein n=1 Tax=Bradyrhizobium sp. STM 3843 TaxID=551947 RepID=UPI000240351F|nr:ankyrin repeat domain-containing protein [Bradyrhizobium sp. STM 3843]CCE08335.1 putative Ankyrin [Bradyrhizobium sp. STM 3843]
MTRFSVEPLPPRPSLEHQQKLAKRLLRNCWARDADAIERARTFLPGSPDPDALKLHDAQLIIARGYGFDSWAAMKRKIESLTTSPLEQFDIAVREGDAELARALLQRHADIRARINEPRFDFDAPAVHQARKNLALVDVLLQHGADINARSQWWAGGFGILEWDLTPAQAAPLIDRGARITPWAAAGLGLYDELKSILTAHPHLVNERGGDGKTALHCAATCSVAELLLDNGSDLEARDVDHASTPLQYRIADEPIARLLVARGADVDIFAAARLGDKGLVERCLRNDPRCAESRVNRAPFTAPGLHIYGWTLGFDLTPADVARKFGHSEIAELIVSSLSPKARLIDALWCGDGERARRELDRHPTALREIEPHEHALLASAAWWYRPDSVRLMLDYGFDPHATGAHNSTPLDRASFHGYADIVATLLSRDPDPPLTYQNEFGGIPLGACIYGALNGWTTGHPQDHVRTVKLLLDAGSPLDPTILPTGHDELDTVLRAWLKSSGRSLA